MESNVNITKKEDVCLEVIVTSLNTSFNKSASNNDSANSIRIASADTSLNASLPPSPWESRRIRADLIEAKARIVKFKQEIERQHEIVKKGSQCMIVKFVNSLNNVISHPTNC
ncbi:uncharacterized protein LOC129906614 [Episyrphus balteatus]|uniref:uncharacterized protein LOC129906614 n=1 Tax=Episyrphus balteatus TaxID=286459 RepID=UPI002484D864|nr:uncharacterized protein LOC129906614 [Episyrphus balteatus]